MYIHFIGLVSLFGIFRGVCARVAPHALSRRHSTKTTAFILSSLRVVASPKTRASLYRSADSEERVNRRALVLCYVYLAESIATAAPGWNTRYEDMRYGRLIREIKIESDA